MDIGKDIRYKAKNLLLEYGISKVTLENLIYIIEDQGFEIIEYSQRDRSDSVWTVLNTLNLTAYRCSLCNDEYTEKSGKTSHTSVVVSTQEATCTKAGAKNYKCTTCGYEYTEEIPQKSHSYSAATCTNPKTCTGCGKTEGTALGHSTGGVKCSKCGEVTFKTLTYTGTGSKIIKNISVPNGRFMEIARCILPDIVAYFESERGQREFAEWKAQQEAEKKEKSEVA